VNRIGPGPVLQYQQSRFQTAPEPSDRTLLGQLPPPFTVALSLDRQLLVPRCHACSTRRACSRHPVRHCHAVSPWETLSLFFPQKPLNDTTPLPLSPLAITPSSPHPCHRDAAAPREPLAITPANSRHSARAHHRHRSPATVDRRLWCSSDPIHPTRSIARAQRCSPTTLIEPTTASRPPHRRTPPPNRHRCREPTVVSFLLPFAPNQGHHRPGSLLGHFPADQRRPVGRIRPVSHRHQGGEFPSPVSSAGPKSRGSWAA
jgi:hypothetical protein